MANWYIPGVASAIQKVGIGESRREYKEALEEYQEEMDLWNIFQSAVVGVASTAVDLKFGDTATSKTTDVALPDYTKYMDMDYGSLEFTEWLDDPANKASFLQSDWYQEAVKAGEISPSDIAGFKTQQDVPVSEVEPVVTPITESFDENIETSENISEDIPDSDRWYPGRNIKEKDGWYPGKNVIEWLKEKDWKEDRKKWISNQQKKRAQRKKDRYIPEDINRPEVNVPSYDEYYDEDVNIAKTAGPQDFDTWEDPIIEKELQITTDFIPQHTPLSTPPATTKVEFEDKGGNAYKGTLKQSPAMDKLSFSNAFD